MKSVSPTSNCVGGHPHHLQGTIGLALCGVDAIPELLPPGSRGSWTRGCAAALGFQPAVVNIHGGPRHKFEPEAPALEVADIFRAFAHRFIERSCSPLRTINLPGGDFRNFSPARRSRRTLSRLSQPVSLGATDRLTVNAL
jgi:hypothetical protein